MNLLLDTAATPASFVKDAQAHATSVSVVTKPVEICKGVHVLGPLGDQIIEQALVVDTPKGLVILTGCSHPGVVAIAKKAKEHLGRDIFMVLGGTHLLNHSDEDSQRVVDDLKGLGVQKVGATHCSGDKAIANMQEVVGDVYRFYHQSFKVYHLQADIAAIVKALQDLAPHLPLNPWFMQIVGEGTAGEFSMDVNQRWLEATRPILEAFFHARYFLEMVCKYGKELSEPPDSLPSGWAAVLELYGLR